MQIRKKERVIFAIFSLLLATACGGEEEIATPEEMASLMKYSDAVQKQSQSWASLNKVWLDLAQEKDANSFKNVLSLHGTRQLRNYIDGISRITTEVPKLQSAHNELIEVYKSLDDGLTTFSERIDQMFREKPETARKWARDELESLFNKVRRSESDYLRKVREIYAERGIRLEVNSSNRYEEEEEEKNEGKPESKAQEQ